MPFRPHTHQHEPHLPHKEYLSTFVYGAIDGTVTTFAVVAGVVGAQLSATVILILGFANLLADGFSMAVSNYLSEKAKQQYIDKLRQRELWEMKHLPDVERQEIRDIYHKKGFKGKDLDRAVEIITSNDKVWLDTMMKDELGIIENTDEPTKSALITFLAFNLVGFIPLLAYVIAFFVPSIMNDAFFLTILLTSVAFLTVGAIKAKIVSKDPVYAALETLFVGGAAATIAYMVGYLLRGLVG